MQQRKFTKSEVAQVFSKMGLGTKAETDARQKDWGISSEQPTEQTFFVTRLHSSTSSPKTTDAQLEANT